MKREHEETSDSDECDQTLKCSICSKQFEIQKYLKQHMQVHQAKHKCDRCKKTFSFTSNLARHKKKVHGVLPKKSFTSTLYTCDVCNKSFGRKDNLARHRACVHQMVTSSNVDVRYPCRHCDMIFQNYADLIQHIETNHPLNQEGGRQAVASKTLRENKESLVSQDNVKTETMKDDEIHSASAAPNIEHGHNDQSALNLSVQNRYISPRQNERYDVLTFFANIRNEVMSFLRSRVRRLGGIKWNLCVQVELERDDGSETRMSSPYFRSLTYVSLSLDDMNDHDLNEAFQKMYASLEKYMRDGSGWFIREVLKLEIHTVIYRPLSGSSYIPLPTTLARSNSVINIQNQDEKCFLYSVLASLHPSNRQPEQVEQYVPFENELNMSGIQYPVTLSQIHKFERQNKNISINVFTFENDNILPLRITECRNRLHHVNLLWLKTFEKSHYCLISDLNRFLSRTKSCKNKQYFCPYCLHAFYREQLLTDHLPNCSRHGPQKVELPSEKEAVLKFSEYEKTLKVPFVIYADFETINKKIHTCAPSPDHSYTTPTTKLEVCSYGYKVVCEDERYTKPTVIHRGPDAAKHFIDNLLKEQDNINQILSEVKPMVLGPEHENLIENATYCSLCKKEFTLYDKLYTRIVIHHNHLTGEIIGAACNSCNLRCKQAKFTPVIFHNLKNFDAHILCETLGQFKNQKLTCIAQNTERYVSFTLGQLRFIDSYQFLPCCLNTLVDNLRQDGLDAFQHLLSEFASREKASWLARKGVYPYDYMDNFERFDEEQLPPLEEFYSSLKREHISEDEYTYAQNVFRTFNMTSLGDYHDLYLQTDVLLLSDVFESFRTMCLHQYGLDSCHFLTSPSLSWASLLKFSGVELELITDIDILLMIQNSVRGGISQISKRYKKGNNSYIHGFDPDQPTCYLQYLDANNLYGWSMTQMLGFQDFRLLDKVENFDVMSVPEEGEMGYILEVSLHYPPSLHDLHNCLPLAPEQRHIEDNELSFYANRLLRKLYNLKSDDPLPKRARCEKLLTTLNDKDKYVVHYRTLQLYVQLGMEIKEIHRVLQFRQKAWMRPYIEYNTQKRKEATSTFAKDFYKLMNVSVFGKTMENVRKHKQIELVHRPERLAKLSAKPTYKSSTIFNEDLIAVELLRSKVKLDKPIYAGMCILDLSKCLMYDFWYNYIKRRYPTAELLMTDTDSLLFACYTKDIYEDMKSSIDLFDTSDFPTNHPLHNEHNKKKLGKMKDETQGRPIAEFVGLRSKMYSFVCDDQEQKRAKGIAKVTVSKDLRHKHYKDTLFDETAKISTVTALRSRGHEIFCDTIQKQGLSAFDDKRYLINETDSLAYGHYKIADFYANSGTHKQERVTYHPEENDVDEDHYFQTTDGQAYKTVKEQRFVIDGFTVTPCIKH